MRNPSVWFSYFQPFWVFFLSPGKVCNHLLPNASVSPEFFRASTLQCPGADLQCPDPKPRCSMWWKTKHIRSLGTNQNKCQCRVNVQHIYPTSPIFSKNISQVVLEKDSFFSLLHQDCASNLSEDNSKSWKKSGFVTPQCRQGSVFQKIIRSIGPNGVKYDFRI